MTTATARRQTEAADILRPLFPIGSVVQTKLLHVSRSGMLRSFAVLHPFTDADGVTRIENISLAVADAIGLKLHRPTGGVAMGGCGMDMGYALAYSLSRALYRDGFPCIGRLVTDPAGYAECPSNDHVNESGDAYRNGFGPHRMHSDPGYALTHRHI